MLRANRDGYGNDQYCKLLVHCEETYVTGPSVTFTESSFAGNSGSGHTCTLAKTGLYPPSIVTDSKFNRRAIQFTGEAASNCYVYAGSGLHGDWNFGSDDYTYELWVKPTLSTSFPPLTDTYLSICGLVVDSNNYNVIVLYYDVAGGNHQIKYIITESGSPVVNLSTNANALFNGSFHHIAVGREDKNFYLYHNGKLGDKASYIPALSTLSTTFDFGNIGRNAASSYLNSFIIDEVRLSKHILRWENNASAGEKVFTPPNRAY